MRASRRIGFASRGWRVLYTEAVPHMPEIINFDISPQENGREHVDRNKRLVC